jgi:uncharacterized protein (DUF362 family)
MQRARESAAGTFSGGCTSRAPRCKTAPPNPFVENGKPLLVSVEGEDLTSALRAGIEALGGLDRLLPLGREALLKGSYVVPQPYPVTTAADCIVAVADELARAGFRRSTLFEAQGSRLVSAFAPEAGMRKVGVFNEVRRRGVDVIAGDFLDADEFRPVRNPDWSVDSPVSVHKKLHDAAVVVSLGLLKRHGEARLTCALKIHFGSVSITDRMVAHKNASQGRMNYFDHRLVHFADAVKPQLNVVDARALLARGGPALGGAAEIVRNVNRLILCGDMVATDAYCARLMAQHDETFSPAMIDEQLKHATALGLGTADLDAVKIVEIKA